MGKLLVITIFVFSALAMFFLLKGEDNLNIGKVEIKKTVTPTPSKNPERNIILESPKNGEELKVPFKISGMARVFENQLNYRIKDKNNKIYEEGTLYANSKDTGLYGDFEKTITNLSVKTKLIIEVFDYSAKDGSEIDKETVEVILK